VASAQVLYGSIVGNVTDPSSAAIPGAVITVTNTATGGSRKATSDAAGYYSIPNLLEGDYDLTISANGFKPLTQKGLRVRINTARHSRNQTLMAFLVS
jgi:hypothetical protein